MARSIKLRRPKYTVYLDDSVEEMTLPSDPTNPDSKMETRMEPIVKAFEVRPGEEPPEEGTLFHLASLPLQRVLNAGAQARKGLGAQASWDALQESLTGWSRLTDEQGNEVTFSKERIQFLDMDEALALTNFVMGRATSNVEGGRKQVGNS